jgi:pimeloyl-ACP methyl ester carboxylesterase
MARASHLVCMLAMLSAGLCSSARANNATLVSIPTPRGVMQAFILIKPDHPVASVILFAGGHGALGLMSASSMKWGAGNFLVRTREAFAGHNLMVAIVDAPSDQQQGMNAIFRMSNFHADDVSAVAAYLKKQVAVPVWLVGTSMGTFSAAGGAVATVGDGLVLTSTVTHPMPGWAIAKSLPEGVASMALAKVEVPTLIVSHRKDTCETSPPAKASDLKMRLSHATKVEIALLDGGKPPQSEPCEAKAAHGCFGVEKEAVNAIAKFVSDNNK